MKKTQKGFTLIELLVVIAKLNMCLVFTCVACAVEIVALVEACKTVDTKS